MATSQFLAGHKEKAPAALTSQEESMKPLPEMRAWESGFRIEKMQYLSADYLLFMLCTIMSDMQKEIQQILSFIGKYILTKKCKEIHDFKSWKFTKVS